MKEFLRYALRPLRHFADFSGRSRRSELIAWIIAIMTVEALVRLGASLAGLGDGRKLGIAVQWLAFWPLVPLMVRRLHDTGRSGWWALLGFPALAFNLRHDWETMTSQELFVPQPELPLAATIALTLALIAFWALLLWNDDPNANRWGPNPRYDAPLPA